MQLIYDGVWPPSSQGPAGPILDIVWGGPDNTVFYTATGAFGIVSEWSWSDGRLVDQEFGALLEDDARHSSSDLAIWNMSGTSYLAVTGGAVDGVDVYEMTDDALPEMTSIGSDFSDIDAGLWVQSETGGGLFLAVSNADRALRLWTVDNEGRTAFVSSELFGTDGNFTGVSPLTSFHHGDQVFVVALDVSGNAASLFSVSEDGIKRTDRLDANDGLAISMPTAVEVVSFAGTDYAIVAAAGSNSLTVVSLQDGQMTLQDQVIDDLNTRFDSVGLLETAEFGGRVFIAVSGADSGLTVFTLLPGGRLMSVATLEDQLDAPLDDITAMEFFEHQGTIQLALAGEGWDGLSFVTLQTDIQGPVFEGTAGDDLLYAGSTNGSVVGGAGDDIVVDGAGSDVLVGGNGVDTFVFYDDNGATDTIEDFEVGIDQINLSFLGRAYDLSALELETINGGIRISFQGDTLEVFSQNGEDIQADDLTYQMLFDVGHVSTAPLPVVPETVIGDDSAEFLVGGAGDDFVLSGLQNADFDEAAVVVARLYQAVLGRSADKVGHFDWTQRLVDQELTGIDIAERFVGSAEFSKVYGGVENAEFLTLLYQNVLGRAPDEGGFAAWMRNLENGMERGDVVWRFSESREFQNTMSIEVLSYVYSSYEISWGDRIFRLYQAVLGRAPDVGGFEAWTGNLLKGMDFIDVISRFIASREFTKVFGDTTNEEFVVLLYENVLGRLPDAGGQAAWLRNLEGGMERSDVVSRFVDSAEFIKLTRPGLIEFMDAQGVDDVLEGGEGDDVLQGGARSDVFIFDMNGHGDDIVLDLEAWDTIQLLNADYEHLQDIFDDLEQRGDDVLFNHDGGSILLIDTRLDDLHDNIFVF